MIILGISGGLSPGAQDPACCLMVDNQIVFAAEEERYNNIKSSPSRLPIYSINSFLKKKIFNLKKLIKFIRQELQYQVIKKELQTSTKNIMEYVQKYFL